MPLSQFRRSGPLVTAFFVVVVFVIRHLASCLFLFGLKRLSNEITSDFLCLLSCGLKLSSVSVRLKPSLGAILFEIGLWLTGYRLLYVLISCYL